MVCFISVAKIVTFPDTSKFWSSKYKEILAFHLLSRDSIRPRVKLSNQKLVKERLCYYSVFFCLFHRVNHRLYELDFLVRQDFLLHTVLMAPCVYSLKISKATGLRLFRDWWLHMRAWGRHIKKGMRVPLSRGFTPCISRTYPPVCYGSIQTTLP